MKLMTAEWLGKTWRRQILAALALSALAVFVRWSLSSWLGEHHEFLPGYLAVAAATWLATWRAGLLVAAISVAALNSGLFESPQTLDPRVQAASSVFAFVVVAGLLMYLTHHAFRRMHALSDEVTRLDAADHEKSRFLALIAHELRNPLSAMGVASGMIRSGRLDPPRLQQAWEMMERQSGQMQRLVSDLLDVARIEQGKIELQCKTTSIAGLIERAVADASAHTNAREQRVVVRGDADAGEAFVDSLRIGQVLVNLIHNASKFSPNGAVITLTAMQSAHSVVITVKDNGAGIPPSQLTAIFDSFVQIEPASGSPQGLGLGLALCKNLVQMHGGSITAHSEGAGRGAEFVVTLPRAAQPKAGLLTAGVGTGMEAPPPPPPPKPATLRVLVVDDNRDAAESLAMLLGMSGHRSSTAADGQSALAQVAQERPDFIFLDIGLPDMSGHEVAMRLRQNLRGQQPVMVALTGWGGEEDTRLCKQSGFDAHLTKPVSMEQIEQALSLQPRRHRVGTPDHCVPRDSGCLELSAN